MTPSVFENEIGHWGTNFLAIFKEASVVDMFVTHCGCPRFRSECKLPLKLSGSDRMQLEYIFGSSLHSDVNIE